MIITYWVLRVVVILVRAPQGALHRDALSPLTFAERMTWSPFCFSLSIPPILLSNQSSTYRDLLEDIFQIHPVPSIHAWTTWLGSHIVSLGLFRDSWLVLPWGTLASLITTESREPLGKTGVYLAEEREMDAEWKPQVSPLHRSGFHIMPKGTCSGLSAVFSFLKSLN